MPTISLNEFLPEVLPECEGVPTPVALNALRNAAFDFCRKSLWINEVQDPVNFEANTADYTIDPPAQMQVVAVLSVNINDALVVYPRTQEALESSTPTYRVVTSDLPQTFVQTAPNAVRFVPIPTTTTGYFVPRAAYAPSRTATAVDRRLLDLYLETIKYGALWKLKIQPNKPWTDPAAAGYYSDQFWRDVHEAAAERNRSDSQANLMVAQRAFA